MRREVRSKRYGTIRERSLTDEISFPKKKQTNEIIEQEKKTIAHFLVTCSINRINVR